MTPELQKVLTYHVIFVVTVLWPAVRVCRRAGLSPFWPVLLCVPLFGLVLFSCALGFCRWPVVTAQGENA